jgi:hypothetical protein
MADFKDLDLLKVGNTIQLVGATWVGEGKMYLCMFPGDHGTVFSGEGHVLFSEGGQEKSDEIEVETLNMTPEEWEQFIRQTDIMEVKVLAEGPDGGFTKSIVRKSARQIAQHISWAVFRRDGYRCRYCGKDDVPLTVDHLVLWEEGGPSTEANLVAADKRCNKTRGNLPYGEWLEHPYYKKVSANLTEEQREANRKLLDTLDNIPRMVHKPTKRK